MREPSHSFSSSPTEARRKWLENRGLDKGQMHPALGSRSSVKKKERLGLNSFAPGSAGYRRPQAAFAPLRGRWTARLRSAGSHRCEDTGPEGCKVAGSYHCESAWPRKEEILN